MRELKKIHITTVIYGNHFIDPFLKITLPNLIKLIETIPLELRKNSKYRIATTKECIKILSTSNIIKSLKKIIKVEIVNYVDHVKGEHWGGYSKMVHTQERLVVEASKEGAAIIFIGPDLIFSNNAFSFIIEKFKSGKNIIVGPSFRILKNESEKYIKKNYLKMERIEITSSQMKNLLKKFWHPVNNLFVLGHREEADWKAYIYDIYNRDMINVKFFQGPTFAAWPLKYDAKFSGFIDHNLTHICCSTNNLPNDEICIVKSADELMALDLTENERIDGLPKTVNSSTSIFNQLCDKNINDIQLRYGLNTCEINFSSKNNFLKDKNRLDNKVNKLIFLAIIFRKLENNLKFKLLLKFIKIIFKLNLNLLSSLVLIFAKLFYKTKF